LKTATGIQRVRDSRVVDGATEGWFDSLKSLERALLNLLLNACEVGAGLKVTKSMLGLRRNGQSCEIRISDRRAGIAEAVRSSFCLTRS